jgi:hypothetical protein
MQQQRPDASGNYAYPPQQQYYYAPPHPASTAYVPVSGKLSLGMFLGCLG